MKQRESSGRTEGVQVRLLPFDVSVRVPVGTSLLDAVRGAGLPLKASCGGKGTCGECVVRILEGAYETRPSAALPKELADDRYVLACLTKVTADTVVDLPHFEELYIKSVASFALLEEEETRLSATTDVDPPVSEVAVDVPAPTLEDNYADLTRIVRALRAAKAGDDVRFAYPVLKTVAKAIREKDRRVSLIMFADGGMREAIDVRPAARGSAVYGLACDIGTTTVAVSLVDLRSGEVARTALGLNLQVKCGEDIISRINFAGKSGGLEELRNLAVITINNLIDKATLDHGIPSSDIYYASVSGNTTMIHLLMGLEPRYIREEPYVPTFNRLPFMHARDLGFNTHPAAKVYFAPAVGSYVGGDITAGLLATPMLRDSESVSMFVDAGTNGELVVGNKDWLMTCACSAGPAFEGGGVRCGMPATEGAIERIKITDSGDLEYRVIENSKPRGVCGSGLVDLLAELLVHGYIDRQGKIRKDRVGERLVEGEDGVGFLIERAENCHWGYDLVITERDTANLIRTKGAVFSACALLLKQVGLTFGQIDAFYIAGGFGHHLDVENAIRIGLLPDLDRQRFRYLGNSSLLGAYLILISDRNRKMVEEVSRKMTYVELNTEPSYMNEYTGSLFLPHTDLDFFPSVKPLLNP